MVRKTQQFLWRLLAVLALLAGFIGALLPVMPTVPFVLLAPRGEVPRIGQRAQVVFVQVGQQKLPFFGAS